MGAGRGAGHSGHAPAAFGASRLDWMLARMAILIRERVREVFVGMALSKAQIKRFTYRYIYIQHIDTYYIENIYMD